MFTLHKVLWLSLVVSTGYAQSQPATWPAPRGWTDALRTEVISNLIVRGRIRIEDPSALSKAVLERGTFVDLDVEIRETLKGHFDGEHIPLTFFATPANHHHRFAPSAEDMRKLIGRELVLFLVKYTDRHYFLADQTGGTGLATARSDSLQQLRRRIELHAEQAEVPPRGKLPMLDRIRELLDLAVKDKDSQARAFQQIEALGREAIPALIRALDDERELPSDRLVLRHRRKLSWSWLPAYRPKTVAGAICTVLHEMTGESFGLDYARPTAKQRRLERRGWNIYASYLQREIAIARAAAALRQNRGLTGDTDR